MKHTILIVEDNILNKKLFEDILYVNGFETIATENGYEAQNLALEYNVSLVLMDIQLPDISGLDVIKMFRSNEHLKNLPIIAVTAFAMKGDEEIILSQGASAYLAKPISVKDLLGQINFFLRNESHDFSDLAGGIA